MYIYHDKYFHRPYFLTWLGGDGGVLSAGATHKGLMSVWEVGWDTEGRALCPLSLFLTIDQDGRKDSGPEIDALERI